MSENFKARFKDEYGKSMFWKSARTFNRNEFEQILDHIKLYNKDMHAFIAGIPSKKWANSHFPAKRYGVLTTARAESWNALLKCGRRYPICSLIDHTRKIQTSHFCKRYEKAQMWDASVTPKAYRSIETMRTSGRALPVRPVSLNDFEVMGGTEQHCVDLEQQVCTCKKYQFRGIPCAHAIKCIDYRKWDVDDFCDDCFSATKYRDTYKENLGATRDRSQWAHVYGEGLQIITAPNYSREAGRPKDNRIESQSTKKKMVHTCSACGVLGHNIRRCPTGVYKTKEERDQQYMINRNKSHTLKRANPVELGSHKSGASYKAPFLG